MDKLAENAAAIIQEAAKSPLGLFALMILVLATLGFFFFRESSERVRIAVFAMMFAGAAIFGAALFLATGPSPAGPAAGPGAPPLSARGNCMEEFLSGIPEDRIAALEEGSENVQLLGPHQSKEEPVAIRFTENNGLVGAVRLQFFPAGELFKISSASDARCRDVRDYSNSARGGSKHVLQNWDTLQIRFDGRDYALRLGHDAGVVEALYFRRTSPDR